MNKKRLGKFIAVSSVFVLSTVTGLVISGCSAQHKHNLTQISAVDPTCTTDGHSVYYACDGCEMIFSDAEGKTEIAVEDTVVAKLGHDLEHHDADPATCTKPGNIEYWECTRGDGMFSDAEGKNSVDTVVTTKDHTWGETGHHAQVDPTTETEGTKEYWHCSECNLDYADQFGDKTITQAELKIDKVSENVDGVLTESFYPTDNALTIGAEDVLNGGLGIVINAKNANDGVYLHIVANYDVEATKQPAGKGKIGLYFNVRNSDNLNLPGGAGVCLEQAMLMELYLTGKVEYHKPYFLLDFDTKTNEDGAKTKYTGTWEMFIPHSGFATVNDGAFAEAFETVEGKVALKSGYTYLITAIGAFSPTETFTNNGASECALKDENTWAFWTNNGHGDWASDQKYYVLGAQGITPDFQRATDTYKVNVNNYTNATVTGINDTVDYNQSLQGTVTVNDGYRLSGIKVNGELFKFTAGTDDTYAYAIEIAKLKNLKWNDTELTVEIIITKLDYQNVEVTLYGVAGGNEHLIAQGATVTIVSEFGEVYTEQVGANGKVQFSNVLCQNYSVQIDDYIDGSLTVIMGEANAQAILEYHFAHNAGTRPDLVDLTDMNAQNASVTLGAQNVNGVDQDVIAVQLNLSDEMKNAEAYVLYTTVTVNGDISASKSNTWLQRFGIRFVAGQNNAYKNKFVVWWDDLAQNFNPSAIWADETTSCGGGADRQYAYDWLASSVMDGLQLKVVRNGGYIAISAYSLDDNKWFTLLEGTTSATAKNDITFFVSGESFTFSEISYEALEVIPLSLPHGTQNGVKGHLKAKNGDVFTLSGVLTSLNALTIPYDSLAYTDYDNVIITEDTITINGNGIADRNSHSYNHATYILSEEVSGEKQISLSFNVKDTYSPEGGDNWAARRFGIQIGEGAYGVYFWTSDASTFTLNRFVVGTLDMNTDQGGQEIVAAPWAASLIRSANGLDVQIVRMDGKIIVNFKNANGEWVRVGETVCADVETEIKFVGGGDNWQVSQIAVGKLEHKVAVQPSSSNGFNGNIEYYTDGTHYYLSDGSVTTHDEVIIKRVNVTLSVTAKELDGTTSVTLANGTEITLTGSFEHYVYTVGGTSNPAQMYAGTYEAYLYGYGKANVVVPEDGGAVEIALVKTIAYGTVGTHGGNSGVVIDGTTVTIKGNALVDNTTWAGKAEIVLSDELKNSKSVVLTFNLKDTNSPQGGWDWAARRFGITMQGTTGGIMCFTPQPDESAFYIMGDNPEVENGKVPFNDFASLVRSESGANMRIVRLNDKVMVFVEVEENWVLVGSFDCNGSGNTEITLYGEGDDWQFSNIQVAEYAALAATVKKGDLPQGVTLNFSAATLAKDGKVTAMLAGGKTYLVSVNGNEMVVGSTFDIAYNDYVLGLDNTEIIVTVLKVSDTSAEISLGSLGTNNTIDLTASTLDGKELLDWNRYRNQNVGATVTKSGDAWATTGMVFNDGGGDYDDPNSISINSGEGANGQFFCMGGGNLQAHSSVTVKVAEGATQINIYTGSWQGNNNVKFTVKIGDVVLSTQSYVFGNDRRSALVTIAIDTSDWTTEEVRDIVIEIEPATQGYMLAAIAVLGE